MTDLAIFTYHDQPISFDSSARMWNLNEMHRASGASAHKAPAQWLRSAQAKELITELLYEQDVHGSDMENSHIATVYETRKGGAQGGSTWATRELAMAYAHYLRPAFYIACNRWMLQQLDQMAAKAQVKLLPAERVVDSIAAMGELIREHFDIDETWGEPLQSPCMSMKEIIDELYAVGALRSRPKYHMEHGNNRRRYYEEMAYEALQGLVASTAMRYRGNKRYYFGVWPKRVRQW